MGAATNETLMTVLKEALQSTIRDLLAIAPKVFVAALIIALIAVVGMLIVRMVRRILASLRIDDIVKPVAERYQIPLSITSIVVALIEVGLAILAIYVVAYSLFPSFVPYVNAFMNLVGKVISVIVMIFIVVISLTLVIERMRIERGLRGFMLLLTLLISLTLIIDVTNISPDLKRALAWGLSLGIGLSIGVFTAWYFFREFLERKESRGG